MRVSIVPIIAIAVCAGGCGSASPSPGGGDIVTGSERFGWDQAAADAGELATFRYALYVDAARGEATDVSCGTQRTGGRFACTSRLPELTPGTHTLEIAAFVTDEGGVTLESLRSPPVRVVKR